MKLSKKLCFFLSTLIISSSILLLSATVAEAKASSIVILTNDSSYYEYNYTDLRASAVSSILGDSVNGALYTHFSQNKATISSYYDDVRNVYVQSSIVSQQAVDAALNGTTFDFKAYMENSTTPSTTVTSKKVQNTSGAITVDGVAVPTTPSDSSDFDVEVIE